MTRLLEDAVKMLRWLPRKHQDQIALRLLDAIRNSHSSQDKISIDGARDAFENGDFMQLAKWRSDLGIDT